MKKKKVVSNLVFFLTYNSFPVVISCVQAYQRFVMPVEMSVWVKCFEPLNNDSIPLPVTLWRSHAHVLTPRSALPARMYDEAMIELLLSHPICYSRSCTFCAPAFCSLCSTIHGVFGSLLLSLALNFSVIYVIQISPMSSGRLHESSG